MIAGGLLTLAVFVFVTALINRELTYVIFAAWLVGNLRLCANAMGWDMEWLGRVIPPDYMPAAAPVHVRRVLPADGGVVQSVVPARTEGGGVSLAAAHGASTPAC